MAGTLGKILKGIGKGITATDSVIGKAVDGVTVKAVDGIIGAGTKAVKGSVKAVDMADEGASALQKLVGFKMKPSVGLGIAGAFAVGGGVGEGIKTRNVSKLGDIQAGELANMVSFTRSPDLEGTMQAVESNSKLMEKFQKDYLPINAYGAEGDIVFALHNLRNR